MALRQEREAPMPSNRRQMIRKGLTALFIAGALYATVVGFLWFAADFIAASIYSPNLDQAQQVADFNDFAYIGEMLAGYRFVWGALALVMAIALLALAVLINDREPHPRAVFAAGTVALLSQAALLSQGWQWGFALLFAATALTLYLATEWLLGGDDATAEVLPAAADVAVDGEDETWPREPTLPVVEPEPEPEQEAPEQARQAAKPDEPVADVPPQAENVAAPGEDRPDEQALESLGLEIESDINLDLEPDYQLASAEETEEDPLLLLSQEDLGIDVDAEDDDFRPDDTIQTAAAIEAEVAKEVADVPLDQASTTQIKAMLDLADENPIGTVAKELNPVVTDAKAETPSAPAPAAVPGFDPQELARQESLLPPPRKRVWNLLDWVIVSVIVVAVVGLLIMNL